MPEHRERIWLERELITPEQYAAIEKANSLNVFSVFWELQFLLYAGVILFTSGLGILIYEHIGSLGHVLANLGLLCLVGGGFYYLFSRSEPYSTEKVDAPNAYFDYIALLTAILLATSATYLQVQFEFFGSSWTWLPLLSAGIYGYMAYRFDHKGILSLAIASLASFFGLNVQPDLQELDKVLESFSFYFAGLGVSLLLTAMAYITVKRNIKLHFEAIYAHFAALLALGSAMSAMFEHDVFSFWSILALLVSGAVFYYGWQKRSTWFVTYAIIASYIILSALFAFALDSDTFILLLYYFAFSPAAPIILIIQANRRFKE